MNRRLITCARDRQNRALRVRNTPHAPTPITPFFALSGCVFTGVWVLSFRNTSAPQGCTKQAIRDIMKVQGINPQMTEKGHEQQRTNTRGTASWGCTMKTLHVTMAPRVPADKQYELKVTSATPIAEICAFTLLYTSPPSYSTSQRIAQSIVKRFNAIHDGTHESLGIA